MKLGMIRIVQVMLVAVVLAVSCKEQPKVEPKSGLSLSESNAELLFDDTSTSVTVIAYSDWTLSVDEGADWITPDKIKGDRNTTTTVNFTIKPNDGEVARTGMIAFRTTDKQYPYVFSITQNAKNTLKGINKWIYEELSDWYYWNDVVKATAPPSNSLGYEEFLEATIESLPWEDVQDTSNGENPATIDGEYALNRETGNMVNPPTRGHIYSYIERTEAGTRAAEGEEKTFGFSVVPFGMTGNAIGYLVSLVDPGSPADKAGLKRGMWILEYNGAEITRDNYLDFQYQLLWFEGGDTMNFSLDVDGDMKVDKDVSLSALTMKVSPIVHSEVITTSKGKKVAYLLYNAFEWGPMENGTREFENDLREVFEGFKTAGATELVLDLRYNGGGYVHTCQVLTSLIGNVTTTDVFAKTLRNKSIKSVEPSLTNPYIDHFFNEPNSMKLSKIYVLATRSTASASEMVINALRGVDVEVVHIGARTNGKNVGMDLLETTIDGYNYEMRPITFKTLNAKDFTNYANGFAPTHTNDEFWDVTNREGSGVIHDFGTDQNGVVKERLLKAALDLIDGKTVQPDSGTRAGEGVMTPLPVLRNPHRGGAIYVHRKQQ
jgi:hypothetical protein